MCGRITCYLAPDDVSCSCQYRDVTGKETRVAWVPEKFQTVRYVPSYHMGPRDTAACVVSGSHFNDNSERILCPMMWGMIPPWHKGEYKKHNASTHNGRLENLSGSKLYGKPLRQGKRCVIVLNGFYEWKTDKKSGKKQPYYVCKKTPADVAQPQLLTLAGLFDEWKNEEGKIIYSCTILTTDANEVLSWLHHRAPVILQTEEDVNDWLNYKNVNAETALAKLRSINLSPNALKWHPVAVTVNNVRNKDKSCIEPIVISEEKKKTGGLSAWLKTDSVSTKKRKSSHDKEDRERTTKTFKKD